MIFDRSDRARDGADFARAHRVRPLFDRFSDGYGHSWLGQDLGWLKTCPVFIAVLLFSEKLAGVDELLDFAGAFADGAELHVTVKLLRGIVLDEAVAAVNLHALVGDFNG